MFIRRHMLAGSAAMGLSFALGSAAASRSHLSFDAGSTPYASAKSILRRRPQDLHAGSAGQHDLIQTLHSNFALLIEYNFARLSDDAFKRAWHGLTRIERSLLAPMYDNSIAFSGAQPRLLELVAERADLPTLALVGSIFDSVRLEEALMRFAPDKLTAFRVSKSLSAAPELQAATADPTAALLANGPMSGSMLDYTIQEIYLSYRTAPVGALGVRAALYETTRYVGRHLGFAATTGHAIGTAYVAPLIQEHAPSLWHNIGATVHHTVEALSGIHDLFRTAQIERQAAQTFEVPSEPYWFLQNTGGDFGVVWAWRQVYGDGGGNPFCSPLMFCPPMSEH